MSYYNLMANFARKCLGDGWRKLVADQAPPDHVLSHDPGVQFRFTCFDPFGTITGASQNPGTQTEMTDTYNRVTTRL